MPVLYKGTKGNRRSLSLTSMFAKIFSQLVLQHTEEHATACSFQQKTDGISYTAAFT